MLRTLGRLLRGSAGRGRTARAGLPCRTARRCGWPSPQPWSAVGHRAGAFGAGQAEHDVEEGVIGAAQTGEQGGCVVGEMGEDGGPVEVDIDDGGDGRADGAVMVLLLAGNSIRFASTSSADRIAALPSVSGHWEKVPAAAAVPALSVKWCRGSVESVTGSPSRVLAASHSSPLCHSARARLSAAVPMTLKWVGSWPATMSSALATPKLGFEAVRPPTTIIVFFGQRHALKNARRAKVRAQRLVLVVGLVVHRLSVDGCGLAGAFLPTVILSCEGDGKLAEGSLQCALAHRWSRCRREATPPSGPSVRRLTSGHFGGNDVA